MTKLHQILAIERGVVSDAARSVGLATQGLGVTGDQSPLSGLSRTYEPRSEDGDRLPGESQHVQIRVEHDVLPMVAKALTRLFDVKATREQANAEAKADVVVDGNLILANVPVGYLLFLEQQLAALKDLVRSLPVLDPSQEWHWDKNRGAYATAARKTVRPERVPQVQVLYGATPEHPAQVRPYEVERPVGDWTLVRFSGALPADRRSQIEERVIKLAEAVKYAREKANSVDVTDRPAGDAVFGYLFA